MSNILPYLHFSKLYDQQRPHDVPRREKGATTSWFKVVAMLIGLIAVNIVSGSHTIPTIARTIASDSTAIQTIVGVAGFLAIEFNMFVLMLLNMDGWLKWAVIALSLLAAIASNLYSTMHAFSAAGGDEFTTIIGVVLGLFAPLANLAAGETFRKMFDEVAEKNSANEDIYRGRLSDWDKIKRGQYTLYLKKHGITDPALIMQYAAGQIEASDSANSPALPAPDSERIVVTTPAIPATIEDSSADSRVAAFSSVAVAADSVRTTDSSGDSKAAILARQLIANNDSGLSYNAIQQKYHVSPNTIRQAKALLSQ